LTYDSLMVRALDEPDSYYGLVAQSVTLSDDKRLARFALRPQARFHDGSPLTAKDVVFSLTTLKTLGHPIIVNALTNMSAVRQDGQDVIVELSGDYPLPTLLSVVTLPIFSATYWQDKDFTASTLEAPLGSGPYKVAEMRLGETITYGRVQDYWAKDLPVMAGLFNFDSIRYHFYRDRDNAFRDFGTQTYDLREEFTSQVWATRYDFPAVKDGRIKLDTIPDESPAGGQAWHMNTRKKKFSNPRVREAIGLAFDFEWSNEKLFYGLYQRAHSLFENSPLKATGKPTDAELALLEPFKADLPASVFEKVYTPPKTDASGRARKNLRRASTLLKEAGFINQGGQRMTPEGEPFEIEFLMAESGFLRIIEPYAANLALLGITAKPRQVDASQYQSRVQTFDFDMVTMRVTFPLYPSPSFNSFFHSSSADLEGSRNLAGIKNPAVDQLILTLLRASDRESFTTAARCLDRVLRSNHYFVPQWFKSVHNLAYWDKFDRPDTKPKYDRGIIATWWQDETKAAKL